MKVQFNPHITGYNAEGLSEKHRRNSIGRNSGTKSVSDYAVTSPGLNYYNTAPIVFRAGMSSEKLLAELDSYIRERKILSETTVKKAYQEAKEALAKIASWNDSEMFENARRLAKDAGAKAMKAHVQDHGGFWQFFHGNGESQYNTAYYKEMEIHYDAPKRIIDDLIRRRQTYEDIVAIGDQSEAQKEARLKELDKLIEKTGKLIDFQSLQDKVNNMFSAQGGLDDVIAGYEGVKNEINVKFVQPLTKFKTDPNVSVPACVTLYGPTGTGKTTILRGIAEQSKDYAETVNLSSVAGSGGFRQIFVSQLEYAKQRYIHENKRTIMLIDDAEKIFAINEQDAPLLGITLDNMDRSMLEKYGNNYDLISEFKQFLDSISKKPIKDKNNGTDATDPRSATTVFITTNYPHLIHPDILSREGKATKISVGVPKNKDLVEVLSFYFKKMEETAQALRALKDRPDYEDFINGLTDVTPKGKENLKNLIKTGDIEYLKIDYHHMPYKLLAERMNPNMEEGAYSNDDIRVICQNAFYDYLEKNPAEDDFKTSFYKIFASTKRGINPARLKKFNMIDKMIKDDIVDIESLEELLKQRDLGLLSEKQKNVLQYHITRIETELKSLLEREKATELTEEEQSKKAELMKLKEKIDKKHETGNTSSDSWE